MTKGMTTPQIRALLEQALEALEYHTEQTRPIQKTEHAILEIRAELAKPVEHVEQSWNRSIRDSVDALLAEAGYQPDSSARHQLSMMNFDQKAQATPARDKLAKPVDTDDDPLHPQYIAGFKAGAYAARRRMELDPKTAPSVEIGKHTCPRCKETFSAFVPKPPPAPAWHDAPTCAGLWVSSVWNARYFSLGDVANFTRGVQPRWYGPISPDTGNKS